MTTKAFERCHAVTSKWEGGWSNHSADSGGKTMYGVTHRVYDAYRDRKGLKRQSVRKITRDEALDLYFKDYWDGAKCEGLFPGVDLAVYDSSVNSGRGRARKWLLKSLAKNDNHVLTVKNICARRLGFVQSLKIWKTFGKGWGRRIADVQAKGVAWALAAMNDNHVVKQQLEDEAAVQTKKMANKGKAGAGTGAATGAGGGDVAINPEHAEQIAGWALTSILVAGALLAGWFLWRAYLNKQQADAYEKEAEAVV